MSPTLRTYLITLSLFGTVSRGAVAQDFDAYATLDEASSRFASIESLCASFHQVREVPLLGQRVEGRGELCQQRPNLFSMRFSDPAGDLVVVDGTHAWFYTPSQDAKQVIRSSVGASEAGLDLYGEFLHEPRTKYDARAEGRELVDDTRLERIALIPKDDAGYHEAVIWIDPTTYLMRQVFIREENGSTRMVKLSAIEAGVDVPPHTFVFEPPPGTQVITR